MKNLETRLIDANAEVLMAALLSKANGEGQKAKALSVSIRISAIAKYIQKHQIPASEVAELLMKEAQRYEGEAEAFH